VCHFDRRLVFHTDHHPSERNVGRCSAGQPPLTPLITVEATVAVPPIPPAAFTLASAVLLGIVVVILVRRTELPRVSFGVNIDCSSHCIPRVSAVPGHTQSILTRLVADGERRVFRRLPHTGLMPNLSITCATRMTLSRALTSAKGKGTYSILRLFVKHHLRSAQVWHMFPRDITVSPAHPHALPHWDCAIPDFAFPATVKAATHQPSLTAVNDGRQCRAPFFTADINGRQRRCVCRGN